LEKKCNKHYLWFPNENDWFPCTSEYFYTNDKNKTDGLSPTCKECEKQAALKWAEDNRAKWLEHNKRMNAKPEKKKAIKELMKKYRDDGRYAEWCKINSDKVNQYSRNRRQTKEHRVTDKEWDNCKFYFNHRCAYCGLPIEEHYIKRKGNFIWMDFHKEHAYDNGRNDIKNLLPSCNSCNSEKNTKAFHSWYNPNNPKYTYERYHKIYLWLRYDCYKYIEKKKPKQKYERKSKPN
jgi:hypothetical protein